MKAKKLSKRIEVVEVKEKTNLKKWMIIGVFIVVVIMIGSSAAFMGSKPNSDPNSYEVNGYKVSLTQEGWQISKGGGSLIMEFQPNATTDIPIELAKLQGEKIYLPINTTEIDAVLERQRLQGLLGQIGILSNEACLTEEDCPDIPIVSCEGPNTIIYFTDTETSEITSKDNCIILSSSYSDRVRVINAFIYKLLGVI